VHACAQTPQTTIDTTCDPWKDLAWAKLWVPWPFAQWVDCPYNNCKPETDETSAMHTSLVPPSVDGGHSPPPPGFNLAAAAATSPATAAALAVADTLAIDDDLQLRELLEEQQAIAARVLERRRELKEARRQQAHMDGQTTTVAPPASHAANASTSDPASTPASCSDPRYGATTTVKDWDERWRHETSMSETKEKGLYCKLYFPSVSVQSQICWPAHATTRGGAH